MSRTTQVRGLIEEAYVLSLPLVATVVRGDWELGGEVGYDAYRRDLDAFRYGVYTAFQATDSLRLMGEVWGNEFFSGGGIWSELDSDERLRGDFFLGLGWTH